MKNIIKSIVAIISIAAIVSCVDVDERADNNVENFEALWSVLDQKYCYFDYKNKEYGLDWNQVYAKYRPLVSDTLNEVELFNLFDSMLDELRDGHVNLVSYFNTSRYWDWQENYPSNFSDTLQRKYLGTNYAMVGGLKYGVFMPDSIAYVYCGSFSSGFSDNNLTYMLYLLSPAKGLILDIRSNGGGDLTMSERLAARFTEEKILTGYMRHKTGSGHSDFSDYDAQYLKPFNGVRWKKPVVVLTNRGVYSAANQFVNMMKCCPNVKIVGDKTGGGGGMPFNNELPNGWTVRFSACPCYDKDKKDIEFGIEPDYYVSITDEDFNRGKDTIIEFAIDLLK